MTEHQMTLEAEELERLEGVETLEPKEIFSCVHYACFRMMARACVERQIDLKIGRGNGATAYPIHPYCSKGDCEIGKVVASKIAVDIIPNRVLIGSYRGKARAKPKRKTPAPPLFCKGEDCSNPIRRDNKRGFCTRCRMKPAYRLPRSKKNTAA